MLMMRYDGSDIRRLVKGSFISKGKTFNQEGSTIDPIDAEPLSSVSPTTLLPYGIFKDEIASAKGFGGKESYPLENQNVKSSNLEDNAIQTLAEIVGNDIESEVNPSSPRENYPIEKHGSHDPNLDESGVRTHT